MFQFSKRNFHLTALPAATCICLASISTAKDAQISMPMTANAPTASITSSTGGAITVAAMVANYQGQALICGFWAQTQNLSGTARKTRILKKAMETSSVRIKNRTLAHNLIFMNEVSEEDFAIGVQANCKRSKVKWNPSMTNKLLEIRVPRRTAH